MLLSIWGVKVIGEMVTLSWEGGSTTVLIKFRFTERLDLISSSISFSITVKMNEWVQKKGKI